MKLQPYVPSVAGARAAASSAVAVQPRRSLLDRWLLLGLFLVVTLAAFLAAAVPRVLDQTLSEGARKAIAATGRAGDLTLTTPLGAGSLPNADATVVSEGDFLTLERTFADSLPRALQRVTGPVVASVESPVLAIRGVVDRQGRKQAVPAPSLRTVSLWSRDEMAIRWVRGAEPLGTDLPGTDVTHGVPVGMTAEVAAATGLDVGDSLTVERRGVTLMTLHVTGVFAAADAGLPVWRQLPAVLGPVPRVDTTTRQLRTEAAFYLPLSSIPALELPLLPAPLLATITKPVVADRFDSATLESVQNEIGDLKAAPDDIAPGATLGYTFSTALGDAISVYRPIAQASIAQMSLAVVGVIGVAAIVLLLGGELLVGRRRRDIALARARGASVWAVVLAAALESVLLSAVGCLVGAGAAALAFSAPLSSRGPLLVVAVAAAVSTPLLSGFFAFRSLGQRRTPANRSARRLVQAQSRLRRVVVDVVLLVLAIGAVVALHGRGFVAGDRPRVDLFLASAPLLVALAVTVLLLRLYPGPLRALAALSRRGRRALSVVSTARASQAVTVIPLLALTLCIALVTASGLLQSTLVSGRSDAAWQRVGAAARAEGPRLEGRVVPLDAGAAGRLGSAPGVEHVVAATLRRQVVVHVGSELRQVTLVAADPVAYTALLADTPLRYDGGLASLAGAATGAADATLPVVLSAGAQTTLGGKPRDLFLPNVGYVPITVRGSTDLQNDGWISGPVVYVTRAALSTVVKKADSAEGERENLGDTLLLATGPGAERAVRSDAALASSAELLTRRTWTESRGGVALLDDLVRLLWVAIALIAAFGAVVLLETVVSGAAERGRTLSAMRTLGLHPRQGRWLALGELLPLMATAAIGGAAAGVLILRILGTTLGLQQLTGGAVAPPLRVSGWFVVAVPIGVVALLVGAVLLEVSVHRRDRVSEVLRLGDGR